jgi:hypothetical protein
MPLHDDAVVRRFLTELAGEGCDELILVPATNDLELLDRLTEVVAG